MQILEKINNILYNRQKSKIFKKSVTKLIFLLLIKIISYKKKSVNPPPKKNQLQKKPDDRHSMYRTTLENNYNHIYSPLENIDISVLVIFIIFKQF